MKFTKTFCKPGAHVTIVPAGLPVVVQYNEHGLIQKIRIGFSIDLDPHYLDSDAIEANSDELMKFIKKCVPGSVSAQGGTTWVFGVLYNDAIPCSEGIIPQALYSDYVQDILKGTRYTFYAGLVKSMAFGFNNPVSVRNFLNGNKFSTLPQTIVPMTMSEETIKMLITTNNFKFKYPYISGYIIFEDSSFRYLPANLMQLSVSKNVDMFVDVDGYIKGSIITKSGRTYTFNYSAILHHSVDKGSVILVERESENSSLNILATRTSKGIDKAIEIVSQQIKCPVCDKLLLCGNNDEPIQCDDPHCLSHLYADATKMLNVLGLPTLSYNSYKSLVDSKKITCLTDLLDLPPCQEIEINTTIANAMYAVVPTLVVPNFSLLERFANKCNNSLESVQYYLNNPQRIEVDLDIVDPIERRFANWLQDPYNVATIQSVFERVNLEHKIKKFEGDPIFRGLTFAITGKFKRGDYPEIESILRSYSAEVIPEIEIGEKLPDMVLVGSLNDGVSGKMIQKARMHNIAIKEEDEFFLQYEIDKDLSENLL